MGAGKTTLSNALVSLNQLQTSDNDIEVSCVLKMTFNSIFRSLGEHQFRRWEFETATGFTKHQTIASGGGTILYSQLRFRMKRHFVLCLGYNSPTQRALTFLGTSRPLLFMARALCKSRALAYKSSMKYNITLSKLTFLQLINCTISLLNAFYGKD